MKGFITHLGLDGRVNMMFYYGCCHQTRCGHIHQIRHGHGHRNRRLHHCRTHCQHNKPTYHGLHYPMGCRGHAMSFHPHLNWDMSPYFWKTHGWCTKPRSSNPFGHVTNAYLCNPKRFKSLACLVVNWLHDLLCMKQYIIQFCSYDHAKHTCANILLAIGTIMGSPLPTRSHLSCSPILVCAMLGILA